MSTPPDEPTRRLPPSDPSLPPAGPPRVREREVYAEDDGTWLEELRDQVRSLRTAVVLLGILAVAALGVAAWALLSDNDDETAGQTPQGASRARVSDLEERVDDLESRTRNAPSNSDLDDLEAEQKSLANRVAKLESASGQQSDAASQDSVDQIQQDVQALDQRVDDVEQQQRQQQQEQDQGTTP
jgi:DNA repair exonuclease SbcCD ATPase subunit